MPVRSTLTIIAVTALGSASIGAFTLGTDAAADPAPRTAPPVVISKPTFAETDAQRRERLNARLAEMIRTGQGSRLSDVNVAPVRLEARRTADAPVRRRASGKARAVRAPVQTAPADPLFTPDGRSEEFLSTIAPPAMRTAALPPGRGYVAPRLDLRTAPVVPTSDLECLTQAIYYEARNESEDGQAAVAEVVINRSRTGRYPRAICDVVYQRNSRTCQFTFTCDGAIGRGRVNLAAWARAERIAREVLAGNKPRLLPASSVNYHANYVRPSWGRRLERVRQIGAHIFYGAARDGRSTPGAETAPTQTFTGLTFVRNEALERAYAEMMGGSKAPTSGDATVETRPAD